MDRNYVQTADEIRWKLSLIKSTSVSVRLKKRAILDISDYLDECYEKHYVNNFNVNSFFVCHVDSLYVISYKDFIKGMWDAMLQDESYEILHYLKKYLNTIVKANPVA